MLVPLLTLDVPTELIENRKVTQATNLVTFSNLDGEAEGFYKLIYKIKNDSSPVFPAVTVYDIRPNGLTTNQDTSRFTIWTTIQLDAFSFWLVGGADGGAVLAGEMTIYAAASVSGVPLE